MLASTIVTYLPTRALFAVKTRISFVTVVQELIKRSLYLPYLASESTLSRVDLFIEHLPWENQHAHCCKSQSKQSYLSVRGIMILFAGKTCS